MSGFHFDNFSINNHKARYLLQSFIDAKIIKVNKYQDRESSKTTEQETELWELCGCVCTRVSACTCACMCACACVCVWGGGVFSVCWIVRLSVCLSVCLYFISFTSIFNSL